MACAMSVSETTELCWVPAFGHRKGWAPGHLAGRFCLATLRPMSQDDQVRNSSAPLDLHAAARDLWPGGTLDFWQGRKAPWPDRVFWPANSAEAHSVLQRAASQEVPVVPYGAGSGVCGGARGRSGSWVVDAKGMQTIYEIDEDRWTIEADAGVNGQHLEDVLLARGFTLGHSPSSIWCSTVGGWAAARSAGQFSSKYGVFEDMVLALEATAPGHKPFRVGEGGNAPDEWMPLLLGSEGTLGLITKVKMRIWPKPETRWLRGYSFPTVAAALRGMRKVMQAELWPSVVRLYDPVDTRIGGKTKPKKDQNQRRFVQDWLKAIAGLPAIKRRSLVLPLSLPGLVNDLFDKAASGCLVIVGWEGDPRIVDAQSRSGHLLLTEEGDDLGTAPGDRWFHSRHAVSYKLMPIFERGGFADTMEVAVRWSCVEATYDAVRSALRGRAVVMAHMSHVYPEGAAIYFSFAGLGDRSVYQGVWNAAQRAVLDSGATVTHHHGVGFLKSDFASAEVGPAIRGWKEIKKRLDPTGVMNPGRLFREVPYEDPGPVQPLSRDDGMVRVNVGSGLVERRANASQGGDSELMWPWEQLPPPPRWQRNPWQVGWMEVAGEVDGKRALIGRGPRSAAGPDLRGWLAKTDRTAVATVALASNRNAWMGESKCDSPWEVARLLLRSDFRPAVLTVVDGGLRVGFRGPAASELGQLASSQVPGGLTPIPWVAAPMPSGPLVSCAMDDDDVVAVLPSGALKRGGSHA
jgi:alkyldihydroxyacetonephosphate synthase